MGKEYCQYANRLICIFLILKGRKAVGMCKEVYQAIHFHIFIHTLHLCVGKKWEL